MDNAVIVQGALVLWGIVSLVLAFRNFAWNRTVVTIEFWWCVLTVIIIIMACFHKLFLWCNSLPLFLVLLFAACVIVALHTIFHLCKTVSMLVNRNQELCTQIALLNQENEQYLIKYGVIPDRYEENDDGEKESTVCD